MRTNFLPDFRFSFSLCSVKPSDGFSVNAFGNMKKEFHQECWEFLWCPKGNMRTLEADEREEKWGSYNIMPISAIYFIFFSKIRPGIMNFYKV